MRRLQSIKLHSQDQKPCLKAAVLKLTNAHNLCNSSTTLISLYYLCMLAPHELRAVTTVSTNNNKEQLHAIHAHNGAVSI